MGEVGDAFELVVAGPSKLRSVRAECRATWGAAERYSLWWAGDDHVREEGRDGRDEAVRLFVRDGSRWWLWLRGRGGLTNTIGDPKHGMESPIPRMLFTTGRIALDPDTGIDRREGIAGREAIVLRLPEREIAIDAEHGVTLRSLYQGRLHLDVTEIAFDVPIKPDRFEFSLPAGVELLAASSNQPDPKPVEEIASSVDFQVFEPGPIVLRWPVDALHWPAREDKPEVVTVRLRKAPIWIHQSAGRDPESPGSRHPKSWSRITRDGVELEVRERPTVVRLIRDGIHVEVYGEAENVDELITIALALRPVSRT